MRGFFYGNGADTMCLIESGETYSHLDSHELTEGCGHPRPPVPTGSRHHQLFSLFKREVANLRIAREGAR